MRKRTVVLILLVLLGVITFLDRLCIAVAGPRIQADLGITPEQWGWVLGAFVLSYGIFEIPTGALGDRIGQRSVLTRIVGWWSMFTWFTGSVSTFPVLVAVRFLFGAGEAGAYPNIAGAVARWFPPVERARTQGFVWAASRSGGAIAPWLVVPVQQAFGWRAAFFIFGSVGFVWAVVWWLWFRDRPQDQPGITRAELDEIGSGSQPLHRNTPWRALFRSRQLWLIIAMYWFYSWGSWFYFSWLHTFLVRGRGFTEGEMGFFAGLPFIVGAAANVCGGYLSDIFVRRFGIKTGRRLIGTVALTIASVLILLTAITTSKGLAIALLTLGFGVMDLMLPSAWAICLDIGIEHAGAVSGAMNTAGQLGGFVCTVLFGYLVKASGTYNSPLYVISAMVLIGAILFSRIDASRPIFARSTPLPAEVAF